MLHFPEAEWEKCTVIILYQAIVLAENVVSEKKGRNVIVLR